LPTGLLFSALSAFATQLVQILQTIETARRKEEAAETKTDDCVSDQPRTEARDSLKTLPDAMSTRVTSNTLVRWETTL
jgi:hypothetical protein